MQGPKELLERLPRGPMDGPPKLRKGPTARNFTCKTTSQKTYESDFYTNVQWMGCLEGAKGPQPAIFTYETIYL